MHSGPQSYGARHVGQPAIFQTGNAHRAGQGAARPSREGWLALCGAGRASIGPRSGASGLLQRAGLLASLPERLDTKDSAPGLSGRERAATTDTDILAGCVRSRDNREGSGSRAFQPMGIGASTSTWCREPRCARCAAWVAVLPSSLSAALQPPLVHPTPPCHFLQSLHSFGLVPSLPSRAAPLHRSISSGHRRVPLLAYRSNSCALAQQACITVNNPGRQP